MNGRTLSAGAWALCLLTAIPASVRSDAMPEESPTGITVQREEEPTIPGQSGWVMAQSYASPDNDDLLRSVRIGGKCVILRSTDAGKTWGDARTLGQTKTVGDHLVLNPSVASLYLDPDNGLLVCFSSEVIYKTGGGIAYGDAVGYGPHTMRLFYRISRDGGHTWEAPQQLIQAGPEYDSEHPARDVSYGESSLVIEGQSPYRLGHGTIVIPAYLWPTAEYMERIFDEQQWPESLRGDACYFIEARCLTAQWKPDLSGLRFASGAPIRLRGGYTSAGTCGSDEAAVAYLDDRRWFAVLRTGTGHVGEFRQRGIPLVRMSAVTTDGGASWQSDAPLRFDDGAQVYSPSAWSMFIQSSRNDKWYWIGNVLSEPTYGKCDPRYPLQIVELDRETLRLKRATLTVIEDKAPEDHKWVRFSNFRVYEERGTGDFILLLRKGYSEFAPAGLPTPSHRYRIHLSAP